MLQVSLANGLETRAYNIDLVTSADANAVAIACQERSWLNIGELERTPRSRPIHRFFGSCNLGVDHPEKAFSFTLNNPTELEIELNPPARESTVYIRRTCADDTTEQVCGSGDSIVDTGLLPAGNYTLFVESSGLAIPSVTLRPAR